MKCTATRADGSPCGAHSQIGASFCFFHDPARSADRTEAQQAGGRQNRAQTLPDDTPDSPLATVADVVALLGDTINQVRRGALDPRIANALGYLTSTLLKAIESGAVEERLTQLEHLVRSTPAAGSVFDRDPLATPRLESVQ
jgi:hypothetical protein